MFAHNVHVVILSFTQAFWRLLNDHGNNFVCLDFVGTSIGQQEERDEKIENVHKAGSSHVTLYYASHVRIA